MNKVISIFFFISLYNNVFANTTPIILRKGMTDLNIESCVNVLYDKDHRLTYVDVYEKLHSSSFKAYKSDEVPGKFSRSLYTNWLYFRLYNPYPYSFYLLLNSYLANDSIWLIENDSISYRDIACHFPFVYDTFNILRHKLVDICILKIPPYTRYDVLIKNRVMASYAVNKNIPRLFDAIYYEVFHYDRDKIMIFMYEGSILLLLFLFIFFGILAIYLRDATLMWYALFAMMSSIITMRNLEGINPHFLWSLSVITWSESKLFHSAMSFFLYFMFIATFLNYDPPILKKFIKIIVIYISAAVVLELVLFIDYEKYDHLRYLNYFALRIFLTLIGIMSLPLIYQSKTMFSRFIFYSCLSMILFELPGWYFGGSFSSNISLVGLYVEFILFSFTMAVRTYYNVKQYEILKLRNQSLVIEKLQISHNLQKEISMDLHDVMGTALTSLHYLTESLNRKYTQIPNSEFKNIKDIISDMHENLRLNMWALKIDKYILFEFCVGVQSYIKQFCINHGLNYDIQNFIDQSENSILTEKARKSILAVIKEGLGNVIKHSNADTVSASFNKAANSLHIYLYDNGTEIKVREENFTSGNGLKNIQKRIQALNGIFHYKSRDGFHIYISIPLDISDEQM